MAHRSRRQTALVGERRVVGVEALRRDLAQSKLAEVGPDPLGHEASVLAHRGGGELVVNDIEPSSKQLVARRRRRRDLAGGQVGHEGGERSLSFPFRADMRPAQLLPRARCAVARQLNDQPPVPRAAFSQRSLHDETVHSESWLRSWLAFSSNSSTSQNHRSAGCFSEPKPRVELGTYALRVRSMWCRSVRTSPVSRGFASLGCCSVRQNPPESAALGRQMANSPTRSALRAQRCDR